MRDKREGSEVRSVEIKESVKGKDGANGHVIERDLGSTESHSK